MDYHGKGLRSCHDPCEPRVCEFIQGVARGTKGLQEVGLVYLGGLGLAVGGVVAAPIALEGAVGLYNYTSGASLAAYIRITGSTWGAALAALAGAGGAAANDVGASREEQVAEIVGGQVIKRADKDFLLNVPTIPGRSVPLDVVGPRANSSQSAAPLRLSTWPS